MLALKKVLSNNLTVFRRDVRLIGSQFEISVVGNDPIWADERIDSAIAEINRVEKLLSTFGEDSEVNAINRNAGVKPVKVSGEIFRLIDRSLKISELTYGAFDITYYSADKLFIDHNNDPATGNIHAIPYSVNKVNYQGVVLDANNITVFLKEKGMRIGFAANIKGYAADRAKYVLQLDGVSSGVINAGGDLLTWGLQPDMEPWTVSVADPRHKIASFADIEISDMAVATSVITEKYATIHPKKQGAIHHKNGFALSEIKSVSVLSTSAEFADAMATPLIAIGINAGLYLVNKLNQIGCVIIDDQNRTYTSKGINIA
jgi:thiamine biosynthesis lipoprotein